MAHGENTALGEGALTSLLALSEVEQEVHRGNTAVGWHALNALTGTLAVAAPTAATAIGSSVITLAGVEALAGPVWAGGDEQHEDHRLPGTDGRRHRPRTGQSVFCRQRDGQHL
jgi:hypothetical protein